MFIFMTIGAFFSVHYSKVFSIVSSSIVGSYIATKSYGNLVGNFPSEGEIEFDHKYSLQRNVNL